MINEHNQICPEQMGKCVSGDTKITVRNKNTGEVKEVTIRDFHKDII